LITRTTFGEQYRPLSSSMCSFLLFHEHRQYVGSIVKLTSPPHPNHELYYTHNYGFHRDNYAIT
jgi:hypothetical protein